jgi:hypothetical protein
VNVKRDAGRCRRAQGRREGDARPPRLTRAHSEHGHRRHDRYARDLEISGSATRPSGKSWCSLGYSHPVEIDPPAGISFQVETPTRLAVVGADKELVGQTAAFIRSRRKPEPYKGKGIRYAGEVVLRKAGKAGKVGTGK